MKINVANNTPIVGTLVGCLWLVLAALTIPIEGNACHRGNTHGPNPVPCEDPPPGNDPPGANLTSAGWFGGTGALDLDGPRECGPGAAGDLKADHGEYACDKFGRVRFLLTGGKKVGNKGDPAWCAKTFDVLSTENSSYSYVWNGDCTVPGGCSIEIWNWIYQTHDVSAANGWPEDAGLVIVRAMAPHVTGTLDPNESNPYFDTLDLAATAVEVTFKAYGKNRSLAVCSYPRTNGSRTVINDVIFHTEPR